MAKVAPVCLFHWDDFDVRTDMDRFSLVLDNLPDERIVQYLEVMRGNGRDDYLRHIFTALPTATTLEDFEKLLPWNLDKAALSIA